MNGGKTVFVYHPFGYQNGILKVVTIPGHKGNHHVLPQSQFTQVSGWAVRNHIAAGNNIAFLNQWTLVDTGVLVRTGVLGQVVDINTGFTWQGFIIINTNNDTRCIHFINNTTAFSHSGHTGIFRYSALHTGTHQRLIRFQCGYSLTLHVGPH